MQSFELVLVPSDATRRVQVAASDVESHPHVQPERGVPGRLTYYNRSTSVHFGITLGGDLHSEVDEESAYRGGVPGHVDVLSDTSVGSRTSRLDEEDFTSESDDELDDDELDDDELGDDELEDDELEELPPVSIHLPLFRPTFFVNEALEFLEMIGRNGDLQLAMPPSLEEDDGGSDKQSGTAIPVSKDEVLRRWQELHRQVYADIEDRSQIDIWSLDRATSFYDYNRALARLQEELGGDDLDVLPMQPARHDGKVKTLCVWRSDRRAVLPQTDLVLVQRPRPGGLFRRTRLEELLVPGATVWRLLARCSQARHDPAPLLIVRGTEDAPGQVRAELETLEGEPAENARRTEFVGVVDFELEG